LGKRNYDPVALIKAAAKKGDTLDTRTISHIAAATSKKLKLESSSVEKFIQGSFLLNKKEVAVLKKHFSSKDNKEYFDTLLALEKWSALGLDPALAQKYPKDVAFLVQSRLIFTIVGLQNSTTEGKDLHAIRDNGTGLTIAVEGRGPVLVSGLRDSLRFDPKKEALVSKGNEHEVWNYYLQGLAPVDRFYRKELAATPAYDPRNAELKPVAKLSKEELALLIQETKEKSGKEGEFTGVIQFVTNPRIEHETSALLRNFEVQTAKIHCGIRFIDKEGYVYSTGLALSSFEDNEIDHMLKSGNGSAANIDFEEFRGHKGRITTSLPLTAEKESEVFALLQHYRREGVRFNLFRQNCVCFGAHLVKVASDEEVSLRLPLESMIAKMMPTPLSKTIGVSARAFKAISPTLVGFISKIGTLFKNHLAKSMGGTLGSALYSRESGHSKSARPKLASFEHLFDGENEHASDIHHASLFVKWQLEHRATTVSAYKKAPSMSIMPPRTLEEKAYSDRRKQEFTTLFA
jgi:hypothetical protein